MTSIACPACGKNNQPQTADACQRCGCDLAMLYCINLAAICHLTKAAAGLRQGNWEAALAHAEASWTLRHSIASAWLAFLAAAALGDTNRILFWRGRARS